jgi:HEAT repeat protein
MAGPDPPLNGTIDNLVTAVTDTEADFEDQLEAVRSGGLQAGAVGRLGPLLHQASTDVEVRRRIIEALFVLNDASATEHLGRALLNDKDTQVRLQAIGRLGQLNQIGGTIYFQQALADEETRRLAFDSLGISVRDLIAELRSADDSRAQELRDTLNQVELSNLDALLNGRDEDIARAAAAALGIRGGDQAVNYLCGYLEAEQQRKTGTPGTESGDDDDWILGDTSEIVKAVITALGAVGTENTVPCLGKTLERDLNERIRLEAAVSLGDGRHASAARYLVRASLEDESGQVRSIATKRLRDNFPEWRDKTTQTIAVLSEGNKVRGEIPATTIVDAIAPPAGERQENPYELADFLIAQTVNFAEDKRMLPLLAELIEVSANGNRGLANQRIDYFVKNTEVTEKEVRALRFEIGGTEALQDIEKLLAESNKIYFQEPVKQLNEETRVVWRQTIRIAQWGFGIRALLSVLLFGLGLYLVFTSYTTFLEGNLKTEEFFGPGVSFVAGLGTMFSMVFWGPLREIRKGVADVGEANAIFIGYIHRVLQVSHTFSSRYLSKKGVTNEDLGFYSQLIDDNMNDAIVALRTGLKEKGRGSAEELAGVATGAVAGQPSPVPLDGATAAAGVVEQPTPEAEAGN